jgi:hypothetical protein
VLCRDALRAGKRFLKEANGSAAMVRFEKALMLSKAIGDKVSAPQARQQQGGTMLDGVMPGCACGCCPTPLLSMLQV